MMPILANPPALQDIWPNATCYGCGPNNPHGLHIKSYWSADGNDVICSFAAQPFHNAGFENVMYGGLVACLCDCHSIWAAIAATYKHEGREHGSAPIVTYVTGSLNISYLAPTPLDKPVVLRARVTELAPRKAIIETTLSVGETITARANVIGVRIAADKSIGILGHASNHIHATGDTAQATEQN